MSVFHGHQPEPPQCEVTRVRWERIRWWHRPVRHEYPCWKPSGHAGPHEDLLGVNDTKEEA